MATYAYRGHKNFIDEVEPRLAEAGFTREREFEIADFAILFVPSMSELEDIYFGDDGLIQRMKHGSVIVDLSSTTPNFAKEAAAIATLSELPFVEAPLAVKNMAQEAAFARGNLTCFSAGEEDAVSGAGALLDAIFGAVEPTGGAGSAQLAHAAVTLQRVAEVVAAIESTALFRASKLPLVSPEATSSEAHFVLQAVQEERFNGSFTCEMLYGALVAAIMAADDYELIMPQAEAASHILELIAVIGGADMSPAAVALVYGEDTQATKYGLDWSRADALYGAEQYEEDDLADGFGSFDDYSGYDEYDEDNDGFNDYSDDPYGEGSDVGFGYSAN